MLPSIFFFPPFQNTPQVPKTSEELTEQIKDGQGKEKDLGHAVSCTPSPNDGYGQDGLCTSQSVFVNSCHENLLSLKAVDIDGLSREE